MENVNVTIKGDVLTITCNIGKGAVASARPSASGKTRLLATTGGAFPVVIPGTVGASVALNLMIK